MVWYKHNFYIHWETKKFTCFILSEYATLLLRSGTKPAVSPRYVCFHNVHYAIKQGLDM